MMAAGAGSLGRGTHENGPSLRPRSKSRPARILMPTVPKKSYAHLIQHRDGRRDERIVTAAEGLVRAAAAPRPMPRAGNGL